MSSTKENKTTPTSDSYLPRGFVPGEYDVVIGRSMKYCNHSGNLALRNVVSSRLDEYAKADKSEKSFIISEVTDYISSKSETGDGFLKLDPASNLWYKVSEYQAREHVSQRFRDALGCYRSSSQSKKTRRKTERGMALAEANLRSAKRMRFAMDFRSGPPFPAFKPVQQVAFRTSADLSRPDSVLDTLASILPPDYQTDPNPLEPKHFPETNPKSLLEPLPFSLFDTCDSFPPLQPREDPFFVDFSDSCFQPAYRYDDKGKIQGQQSGFKSFSPNIRHATSA